MQGIRIRNKRNNDPVKLDKGYELFSIVNAIKNNIQGLQWILNSHVNFNNFSKDGDEFRDYQEKYDELIIGEKKFFRLAQIDFLLKYSKFIIGDWDIIFGVLKKEDFLKSNEFDYEFIVSKVTILFRCIDGNFWEIYAQDKDIIDTLGKEFSDSEMCTLNPDDCS